MHNLDLNCAIVTSHMCLCIFELSKIKLKFQFCIHTSHISSAQWSHVASGYHIGDMKI